MNSNRVPKVEYYSNQNVQPPPMQVLHQVQQGQVQGQLPTPKEEEKMPLFLIKLWNIVEDPNYQQIIRWDDSGYSFHIVDPYSFCRNVLPHYFKHNNLNSLIRQLNMYGFRKMSPLDKGGLTRAESDQDHLEFSHPHFIRDRPDLLVNIKRKQSNKVQTETQATQRDSKGQGNIQQITEMLTQLTEKQRRMDSRISELTKENEALWQDMDALRSHHSRQQQVVKKLVQFLVAIVQPNLSKRVLKRGILAIDEQPLPKRARLNGSPMPGGASNSNLTEILDHLQRELLNNGGGINMQHGYNNRGPIIAEMEDTDDLSFDGGFVPPQSEPQVNSPPMYSTVTTNIPTGTQQRTSMGSSPRSRANINATNVNSRVRPVPERRNIVTTNNLAPRYQQQQPQRVVQQRAPPVTNAVSIPTQSNMMMQPCTSTQANFTSNISVSPNIDRQLSQELQSGIGVLQEYLNGVDVNIENCRDLLSGPWDFEFLENLADDEHDAQPGHSYQLALEQGPSDGQEEQFVGALDDYPAREVINNIEIPTEPIQRPMQMQNNMIEHYNGPLLSPTGNPSQMLIPSTPELLTPYSSPPPPQ